MPVNDLDTLIVDADDERAARLVAALGGREGAPVVGQARDGGTALRMLDQIRVGVVLLATRLPELDGLTTLRLLRRRSGVPVVVLADPGDVEAVLDALAMGANGYVVACDLVEASSPAGVLRAIVEPAEPSIAERDEIVIVSVNRGGSPLIAETLCGLSGSRDKALYLLVDGPEWIVEPLARRLHRSTPWRCLPAVDGDHLVPGHALVASTAQGLRAAPRGRRLRLSAGVGWSCLGDALAELTHPMTPKPMRGAA